MYSYGVCLSWPCSFLLYLVSKTEQLTGCLHADVQVGHYHVNTKTNAEVIAQLGSHGLLYDAETTQRLRAHCKLPWLSKTVMVFNYVTESR